jgi:hypothetical protein
VCGDRAARPEADERGQRWHRREARVRTSLDTGGWGLMGGLPLQSQAARATDMRAPATVSGFEFPKQSNGQIHLNLKFKLVQTLTNQKLTLPSYKNLRLNMVLKTSKI